MSTELATVSIDFGALQKASDFNYSMAEVGAVGRDFLPYLQLYTGQSDLVKEGKIGLNEYGITVNKNTTSLGKSVIAVPILWRAKALDVKSHEKPVSFYNQKSEQFIDIMRRADASPNSGCMYGPEFLYYLPGAKTFATMMFGTKSSRNVAPHVRALLPKGSALRAMLLDSELASNETHKWQIPRVGPSDQMFEPPPADVLQAVCESFLKPQDSVIPKPTTAANAEQVNADR